MFVLIGVNDDFARCAHFDRLFAADVAEVSSPSLRTITARFAPARTRLFQQLVAAEK